jgi:uncharacterized protein GlcG (DUF336 family)
VVQWGSNDVAIHKAKASVQYKRPTLALENIVRRTSLPDPDGITAIEGGVPIVDDGKIIAPSAFPAVVCQDGQVPARRRWLK